MSSGEMSSVAANEPLRVVVGVATKGRPDQLAAMLDHLALQTLKPQQIIVCCSGPEDVGAVAENPDVQVIYTAAGLPRQRNGILKALPDNADLIAFFDDDYYPDPRWLETVAKPSGRTRQSPASQGTSSPTESSVRGFPRNSRWPASPPTILPPLIG